MRNMIDYKKVIVKKPWGYEYLMYENGTVAVWYLHIRHESRTSLHCHPRKKTGLILLSGEAVVSFLNDCVPLKPVRKLMIRQGLFHSTAAISSEGASVIEIETPCEKDNLVRLEDEYGREDKPYEGSEAMIPIDDTCVQLADPIEGCRLQYSLRGCILCMERFNDTSPLKGRPPDEVVVVLEGGLYSSGGDPVLGPGDIVTTSTLNRLAETFVAPRGGALLSVRKAV